MNKNTISFLFSNDDSFNQFSKTGFSEFDNGCKIVDVELSIMIPTFKRKELVKRAISSALKQRTKFTYNVTVVDNDPFSSDEYIRELINEFEDKRLTYIRNNENIGMFGNWNRCIEFAIGEWVIVLNDDDELEPNYVENMMRHAEYLDDCGAISCQHKLIDDQGKIVGYDTIKLKKNHSKVYKIKMADFYMFYPLNIYGCLLKRDYVIDLGGFDERLYPCSDAALLVRMCAQHGLYLCSDYLFKYRWAVNESQKESVQIDFAKFQILESDEINERYHIVHDQIADHLNKYRTDYYLQPLVKKHVISDSKAEKEIRKDLGIMASYKWYRRLCYRIINKLYIWAFENRKNCIPNEQTK